MVVPSVDWGVYSGIMELNLPKGYLSHSQIESWTKSKPDYRKRYYEGRSMYITPELEFGKLVGGQYEALHKDESVDLTHPVIGKIPRGTTPEYELKCELRGVPVLGYIDSFKDSDLKIHELKTGKTPWTQTRVDRHKQLKMYCACVKSIHGKHNPYVDLHWLVTENYEDDEMIDGIPVGTRRIRLTGELETFHTTVMYNDIIEYEKHVEQVAREISEDYTMWRRLHSEVEEPEGVIDGIDFT